MPRPSAPVPVQGESFVIVGANGSGKSQLGAWLEERGKGARQSHRISAQRALVFQEFIEPLPRERAERRLFIGLDNPNARIENRRDHRWRNDPVGHLLNDFDAVLAALLAQETERDSQYYRDSVSAAGTSKLPPVESRLDSLKRIWHDLLPHRRLSFEGAKVVAAVTGKPGVQYHGRSMSDGERVMLYLIGQCLCAPAAALLIIDEPEIHLHRAIRERLWDAIQDARKDCVFVFITHDLEFAASRTGATVLWVKDFDGSKAQPEWEWEECPKNLDLPTELVLQVLGSRKPVLFVEGDGVNSLDAKLYTLLFQSHRVMPIGNAATVDRCVSALRAVPSLHHAKPCGIVDRDHRLADEVSSLAGRGVACCPYAEVENLFVDEQVFTAVASRAGCADVQGAVQGLKAGVLNKLSTEADSQAAQWGEAVVARQLAGFSCKATDAAKVAAAVEAHAKKIDVLGLYAEARTSIEKVVRDRNYDAALRLFNQKGLLAMAAQLLGMGAPRYEQMALAAIRENAGLREHVAGLVPLGS